MLGKPYAIDLAGIPETLESTLCQPLSTNLKEIVSSVLRLPLLVVGSGGSLSGAHFIARLHEEKTGIMARAITPQELYFTHIDPSSHAVLFLTASGNNKDIVRSLEVAIYREFASINILCANFGSNIIQIAKAHPRVNFFEYTYPLRKDGFLAVNSLLSSCILMSMAYEPNDNYEKYYDYLINTRYNFDPDVLDQIFKRNTIVALGGEWSWPALVDLESKFTEAALANVSISDLRNFGHGRHNWFHKRGIDTSLVVFETPPLVNLAKTTLALLPEKYPRLVIRSSLDGPMSGVDLLYQVFLLVANASQRLSRDPGRPGIPKFGRQMYHVTFPNASDLKSERNRQVWIKRKSRASEYPLEVIEKALETFLGRIGKSSFSGVVLDYDGTLCDRPSSIILPDTDIALSLNQLIQHHIPIAIATGRGKSIQRSLRRIIDKKNWPLVLVGNYNGSVIRPLEDDPPQLGGPPSNTVLGVMEHIKADLMISKNARIIIREKQISVIPKSKLHWKSILRRIFELFGNIKALNIVETDHSIDILEQGVSKMSVMTALQKSLGGFQQNVLVIGDQGQYGGNDFEILSTPFSLSVERVSSSLDSCWNLSPPGQRGPKSVITIIDAMRMKDGSFTLDTEYLDKVRDR